MRSISFRSLAVLATFGLAAALATPALADNRAFSARAAELDTASSASCFVHNPGDPTLKNTCAYSPAVFLPMSVDAARWYYPAVYARGWVNGSGGQNQIWCIANTVPRDGSTLWGSGWAGLPSGGGFGGAQVMTFPLPIPVYNAGDSSYIYCQMAQNTTIYSYGWN